MQETSLDSSAQDTPVKPPSTLRRVMNWLLRRKFEEPDYYEVIEDDDETAVAETTEEPEARWPEARLAILERLWGECFVRCGEETYLKEFVPLLGLSERNSLLMVGAGMGGAGKMITEETGAWVTGYEDNEELATLGKARMRMSGLAKKAPVNFTAYDNMKLKARAYDCCISLESLFMTRDKKAALRAITESLRPNGELWYTDFVLPDTNRPNEVVQAWASTLAAKPYFWPMTIVQSLLGTLQLNPQPPDDITRAYRNRLFKTLLGFLASTNKSELTEIVDGVFFELEQLAKLIDAIDSGGLRVVRFHAFKKTK